MRLLFCLLMAVMVNVTLGWVATVLTYTWQGLIEGCVYEGKYYNIGEIWQGENCTSLGCCHFNKTYNMIDIRGCGKASYGGLGENCSLVYPPSSVGYPECCEPKIVCT